MTPPPRGSKKGTKSRMNKQKNTKIQIQKKLNNTAVYPSALSLLLVFLIVFPLSYLARLPPHFSHRTVHTHTPHSFSTLTRSLTAVAAPWKCMEMDPSFVCPETGLLLESEPRRGKMRQEREESWRISLSFLKLCMHSTFLIYSSIYPLNNSSTY